MALSKRQKFRLGFSFTVENTQEVYMEDFFGNEEIYGLNTGVFENLTNSVNLEELSRGDAKTLHRKLVWDKFSLYEIDNVEIMIKIYDLFFLFGEEAVTEIVRDVLRDMIQPTPEFSNNLFGKKERELINKIQNQGRDQRFIDLFIRNAKERSSDVGTEKRIEKLPTI